MTLLWYDVMLILRTAPFFFQSALNITKAEDLLELCMKVPGVWFRGALKVLVYFVLPYGIMATVPTQAFAGTLTIPGLIYAVFVVCIFTALALLLWKLGLKCYRSAGG
jgi:ABC-2 type transport system permease protein